MEAAKEKKFLNVRARARRTLRSRRIDRRTDEHMKKHSSAAALLLGCTFLSCSAIADVGFYVGLEAGQGRTQLGEENDDPVFSQGVRLDQSSDRKDTTFGLYGGYAFTNHFAIELAYADLGETSFTTVQNITFPFPQFPFPLGAPFASLRTPGAPLAGIVATVAAPPIETRTITLDSEALSLAIVGRYELGAGFALLGRGGLAVRRTESSLDVSFGAIPVRVIGGEDKASSGAAVLGLGGEWSFHSNWAARLQAQRHFMLEEEDIYPVEVGDVTTVTAGIEYRF
jgi:opacity protein-like surface antigen